MPAPKTIKKSKNLTQQVVDSLKKRIQSGEFSPGDKLPTEHELIDEFGVSRTVIREALSGLKADQLVDSRQGSGVFVLAPPQKDKALSNLMESPATVAKVIEQHELRTAVEVGAAEIAAQRCSPAQMADIYAKYNQFKDKLKQGKQTEAEDFAFHLAIAKATNNAKFVDFLNFLGKKVIPRSTLNLQGTFRVPPEEEQQLLSEHHEIMDAIAQKSPERAAEAMRRHLIIGIERHLSLLSHVNAD